MSYLLTLSDIAVRAGLSVRTVEQHRQGRIGEWFPDPARIVGRSLLFDVGDVDVWIASRRKPGRPAA